MANSIGEKIASGLFGGTCIALSAIGFVAYKTISPIQRYIWKAEGAEMERSIEVMFETGVFILKKAFTETDDENK